LVRDDLTNAWILHGKPALERAALYDPAAFLGFVTAVLGHDED
jgi:hypothetical protein